MAEYEGDQTDRKFEPAYPQEAETAPTPAAHSIYIHSDARDRTQYPSAHNYAVPLSRDLERVRYVRLLHASVSAPDPSFGPEDALELHEGTPSIPANTNFRLIIEDRVRRVEY